jgi:hypothetical protein
MYAMQAFHAALFSAPGRMSKYFQILARLTQINRIAVKSFKSEIAWDIWR